MLLISIVAVLGIHYHADLKINERCHLSEPRPDTDSDRNSDMDSEKVMTSDMETISELSMPKNLGHRQTLVTRTQPPPISNTTHDFYEPRNQR